MGQENRQYFQRYQQKQKIVKNACKVNKWHEKRWAHFYLITLKKCKCTSTHMVYSNFYKDKLVWSKLDVKIYFTHIKQNPSHYSSDDPQFSRIFGLPRKGNMPDQPTKKLEQNVYDFKPIGFAYLKLIWNLNWGVSGALNWCWVAGQYAQYEVLTLHVQKQGCVVLQCQMDNSYQEHLRTIMYFILNSFLATTCSEMFYCCWNFHDPQVQLHTHGGGGRGGGLHFNTLEHRHTIYCSLI